jgi:hypothetical protein
MPGNCPRSCVVSQTSGGSSASLVFWLKHTIHASAGAGPPEADVDAGVVESREGRMPC